MSILKIKDENGNWVDIPSIKGEKGETGKDGAIQYTAGEGIEITEDNVIRTTTNGGGIVIVGDSLVKGDHGQSYKGYANLSDWLYQMTRMQVTNAGIYGNTLSQVLARLNTDVIALNPKYCVVLAGTNDVNNNEETGDMLVITANIIATLKSNNIIPIFVSIPPRSDNTTLNSKIREYNSKLKHYCTTNDCKFVDVYSYLCKADNNGAAKDYILRTTDNLHLTAYGAYMIAKLICDSGYIGIFNYKDEAQSRLWTLNPFDNFEMCIFTDGVADQFTTINTSGATFSDEARTDIINNLDFEYKYQVIEKPATEGYTTAGLLNSFGAIFPGANIRISIDYDIEFTDTTYLSDTYLSFNTSIKNGDGSETNVRHMEAYGLYKANGTFIMDLSLPVDYTSVNVEAFVFGQSGCKLKLGNYRAYKIG